MRLNAIAVHRVLAATTEREPERRSDDRKGRSADEHRAVLEVAHRLLEALPISCLCQRDDRAEVRTGAEGTRVVVADHEAHVLALGHAIQTEPQHLQHPGAHRIHLASRLEQQHAVAQVEQVRVFLRFDDSALARPKDLERDLPRNRRHWRVVTVQRQMRPATLARREERAVFRLREQRRRVEAELPEAFAQKVVAEAVHLLEGPSLPRVPPLDRAIDGHDVVRDGGRRFQHVVGHSHQIISDELPVLARQLLGHRKALLERLFEEHSERRIVDFLLRTVFQRLPVQRRDVLPDFLVEATARLVTKSPTFHELGHPAWQAEIFTRARAQPF